jgi:hypothetical protein
VISTSEVEEADERATITAVITSVPVSVVNVKESVEVADVPGPMMMEDGSVEVEVSRVVVVAEAWEAEKDSKTKRQRRSEDRFAVKRRDGELKTVDRFAERR